MENSYYQKKMHIFINSRNLKKINYSDHEKDLLDDNTTEYYLAPDNTLFRITITPFSIYTKLNPDREQWYPVYRETHIYSS